MVASNGKSILVVDDAAICREPIAASLRLEGYDVTCAVDGREAWAAMERHAPDLLVLDVAMPHVDGLTLIEMMRARSIWSGVPILLLTAVAEKDCLLHAQRLSVQGCLLKSNFSLPQLLARVTQLIGGESSAGRGDGEQARRLNNEDAEKLRGAAVQRRAPRPPTTLGSGETLRRLDDNGERCTLAGVVKQVMQMAADPRAALSDLIGLVKKDCVLASRVLRLANTAAFATSKNRVCSIDDAVCKIGAEGVGRLAASVGVFQTFPADEHDGFNPLRSWQHSLAVASLMAQMAAHSKLASDVVAHVVGLCHDLGEILLRTNFRKELAEARLYSDATGTPLSRVEFCVFGMTRGELVSRALARLGLPPSIVEPIAEFHGDSPCSSPLARLLRPADACANGLLLANGPEAPLKAITAPEAKALFGQTMPIIDGRALKSEVISSTALLAQLTAADEAKLRRGLLVGPRARRIWYARHKGLASIDPLEWALNELAQVEVHDRMPESIDELSGFHAFVVSVLRPVSGFGVDDTAHACGRLPTLYVHAGDAPADAPANLSICRHPVALAHLGSFIASIG
jgi:CheY-like chemotaxis protein/HD-like signal output (HDOD) protein